MSLFGMFAKRRGMLDAADPMAPSPGRFGPQGMAAPMGGGYAPTGPAPQTLEEAEAALGVVRGPQGIPNVPTRLNGMEGIRNALASNAMQPSAPTLMDGPSAMGRNVDHAAAPDFAGHYAMHGRGPTGMFAPKKRSTGEKVLRTLGNVALGMAAANGDPVAMMRLKERMATKEGRKKAELEFREHDMLVRNLMGRGVSAQDAELYALNPKALSEEFATKLRTRDMAPGHTVRTPGFGTQPESVWTAPKIVEDGPNQVEVDPNAGTSRTLYTGKTDGQWAAETSGLPLGTPQANRFLQDFHLDGQGPTAVDMNRARIDAANQRTQMGIADRQFRHTAPKPATPKAPPAAKPPTQQTVIGRILDKQANGGRLSAGEQQVLNDYYSGRGRGRGNGGGAGGGNRPTATDGKGRTITWDGKNWVDAQGRPVR